MNRIRDLREAKGLLQKELERELNLGRGSISKYEREDRALSPELICIVCDYFDVSADYLLCRSNSPKPVISDGDAELLSAFHDAPPSVAAAILTLLQPYRKRNEADQAI